MTLSQINRASQLAHMTKALWATLSAENVGQINPDCVGWLAFLGDELANELAAIIHGVDRSPETPA